MKISAGMDVHIDAEGILKRTLTPGFWGGVLGEWHRLYTPYVPMDTGLLASQVKIDAAERSIAHTVPYANRQYYGGGLNFKRDRHPLASARWDQAAAPSALGSLSAFAQGLLDAGIG